MKKRLLLMIQMLVAIAMSVSAQHVGFIETQNFVGTFEDFGSSIATGLPQGWGYDSSGKPSANYFSRSTTRHAGSYALYVSNKVDATDIDYVITPQLKGEVKIWLKNGGTTDWYQGKQYANFFAAKLNADGSYTLGERLKSIDMDGSAKNSWTQYSIGTLDEYTCIAMTGSYVYFDDISAQQALIPENAGLQVTAITGEWSDSNPLYANAAGDAVYEGTFKVKNCGNVTLVPDRENYSVSVTSQSQFVTAPETIIPINVTLAPGEESAVMTYSVTCSLTDPSVEGRSAIRITSNLKAYGTDDRTTTNYKQTGWFTLKSYVPKLEVRNYENFRMADYATDLGTVDAPASTKMTLRSIGGSPVILKRIEASTPGVGFTDGSNPLSLPLTLAAAEEKEISMTFTITGGQAASLSFVYGTTYDDTEYTYDTKPVNAVVKDPSLYYEDFDSYLTVPEGWCQPGWIVEGDSHWSFDSSSFNTYAINGIQKRSEDKLISPKIAFAEGQSLTVSAQPRLTPSSGDSHITIYYSTDRKDWRVAGYIGYVNSDGVATKESAENIDPSLVHGWSVSSGAAKLDSKVCKAYVINVPAGEWYLGFESGYSIIDYVFGGQLAEVDNDIFVDTYSVDPGYAMVNHPMTANVVYTNMTASEAPARKVSLYDGETLLQETDGKHLAAYAKDTVAFTYVPNHAGEMNLKVVIANTAGSYSVSTAVEQVNVKEEVMLADTLVGQRTSATAVAVPFALNYYNSRSEWIWDAEHLKLADGANINGITLYYYNLNKDLTNRNVRIYMMNTEETTVGTELSDLSAMEQVYANDNFTFRMGGTSANHAQVQFCLNKDFVYTGGNIHVVMISENKEKDGGYSSYNWEYYSGKNGTSNYISADGYDSYAAKTSATQSAYVPVATLSLTVTPPVLSGIIRSAADNTPIKDAVVTITSGDVSYSSTTDTRGKYSIQVLQPSLEYTITIKATGYQTYVLSTPIVIDDNRSKSFALTIDESDVIVGDVTMDKVIDICDYGRLASDILNGTVESWEPGSAKFRRANASSLYGAEESETINEEDLKAILLTIKLEYINR